jgi:hypothetical protein
VRPRKHISQGIISGTKGTYGTVVRNVFFTLTNVASVYMNVGVIDRAQAHYALALRRAGTLTGLGLAKIRFAALEGLAHCEETCFEIRLQDLSDTREGPPVMHLQKASPYIAEALSEAMTWFEPSHRRTLRALGCQARAASLLANCGYKSM